MRETDTGAGIGQNGGASGRWNGLAFDLDRRQCQSDAHRFRQQPGRRWSSICRTSRIATFTGNGVLNSSTGNGVLEHLALTPAGGSGAYNVYFDNFEVVTITTNLTVNTGQTVTFTSSATDADFPAQTLTLASTPDAPAGATINSGTGDFRLDADIRYKDRARMSLLFASLTTAREI